MRVRRFKMKSIGMKTAVALYALLFLGSCGSDGKLESALLSAALSSIDVTPSSSTINVGGAKQFTATAVYSDTSNADLTDNAIWKSSNTSLVSIDNKGLATGLASGGPVEISATYNLRTGKAHITIN